MSETIVTLSTIPDRIKYLGKVLDSINKQSITPDRIELYVPHEYTKRNFGIPDTKSIPSDFTVIRCEDYGPATKILPAVKKYKGTDTTLIYCDDDQHYHSEWLSRLIQTGRENPNCAIAEAVHSVPARLISKKPKSLNYRIKRVLSLGTWKPARKLKNQYQDIVEGCGGVLVRPDFFSEIVFNIPDIVWTVDDVWISANLDYNNIGVKFTKPNSTEIYQAIRDGKQNIGRMQNALVLSEYKGHNRLDADCLAIKYAIREMGVWQEHSELLNEVEQYIKDS